MVKISYKWVRAFTFYSSFIMDTESGFYIPSFSIISKQLYACSLVCCKTYDNILLMPILNNSLKNYYFRLWKPACLVFCIFSQVSEYSPLPLYLIDIFLYCLILWHKNEIRPRFFSLFIFKKVNKVPMVKSTIK